MDASDLDQRITIEQPSIARGTPYGEEIASWVTLATVWASVTDQVNSKKGGDEEVQDSTRVHARRTHIQIRWRADVTPVMRIQWPARTRTFQITGLSELGRREGLLLTCEEYST